MESKQPKRILVVDANEDIRQLIDVLVRKTGNDPSVVATIAEALRVLVARKFDMIICDVGISDGTCERLIAAAHNQNSDMPIIVFMDSYRHALSSRLRDDNCFHVERFNFKQLTEVIETLLEEPTS